MRGDNPEILKNIMDGIRDELELSILKYTREAQSPPREILTVHALCRIADALEKIAAPLDCSEAVTAEREACASLVATAVRHRFTSIEGLQDLERSIRKRANTEAPPEPVWNRCVLCNGAGLSGQEYCNCQMGRDLMKKHYDGLEP